MVLFASGADPSTPRITFLEEPMSSDSPTGNAAQEKLGFWTKLGFGLGDIYGGGSGIVIGFYYLYFLTDVVRVDPALAGTVLLVSRIYDAITDPFEGILTDRTRTRWGRRRPYLIAGAPLVLLSFFLLFYPVDFSSSGARFAFALATYLFFSTVVSIVMLSYNALQAEMTLDYHERASLSSFRIFFSSLSSIVCAVVPLEIVNRFPDLRAGWIAMALVLAIYFAIPILVTGLLAHERTEFQQPLTRINWREGFVEPFRVRTYVFAILMYLLAFVAIDILSSIMVYFMKYYMGRGGETQWVSGALLVAQVLSLPIYSRLIRTASKKRAYVVATAGWMGLMLLSLLVTPALPSYVIYVYVVLIGLCTGGIVLSVYSILPDMPDVGELHTGKRQEGTYSALWGFMRKLSSAFSLFLVGNLLSIAGYAAPVQQVANGVSTLVEQPQSAGFILALRLVFAVVPLVFLGGGLYFAGRFPLTPELHQRLRLVLEARRATGRADAQTDEEVAELTAILVGH